MVCRMPPSREPPGWRGQYRPPGRQPSALATFDKGLGDLAGPQTADQPADDAHAQEQGGDLIDVPAVLDHTPDQQHKSQSHEHQDELLASGEGCFRIQIDLVAFLILFVHDADFGDSS